ncbi:MAG TPA: DUF4229 domain-containing protein [Candidatus Ruania gallistercoris]|uniref:DUF4229 domain-containing protein n=1 Tax=Candidatus Ruania gallistercoris TaxID=2838746 RepID=A0A9D2J4Q5_9MICO|nr:DUF4229 domain-containing protein [Candidatus Ruania gallistercoris]
MPVLVYSLLRILLIVAAGAGLYLAGMRGVLLVVAAVLVGAGLSYVLLDRFRRASAHWLSTRGRGRTRWENRLSSDADDEDALLDEGREDGDALLAGEHRDEDAPPEEEGQQAGEDALRYTAEPTGSDEQSDQQPEADR